MPVGLFCANMSLRKCVHICLVCVQISFFCVQLGPFCMRLGLFCVVISLLCAVGLVCVQIRFICVQIGLFVCACRSLLWGYVSFVREYVSMGPHGLFCLSTFRFCAALRE